MAVEPVSSQPAEPGSSKATREPERRRRNDDAEWEISEVSGQSSLMHLHDPEVKGNRLCCSYRLVISIGAFLAFFEATLLRIGTVMAMVCMTDTNQSVSDADKDCPPLTRDRGQNEYEFSWSGEFQGFITSGVFYGFLVGPFVGGFLSYVFGGRIILTLGTSFAGLTHVLIPELTRLNPYFFFGIRIVTGFFAGMIFPATLGILSHWTVPEERQVLVGGALIGVPFCSVVNFPMNGLLCLYWGWESIFYLSTAALLAYSVFSFFFMSDYPQTCRYLKSNEKNYIVPNVPARTRTLKVPWRAIFTSIPIYSYILTHFCINYVFITVILHLPLFMKEVHHFHLRSNSFLSAAPYIGSLLTRIIVTFTFNKVQRCFKLTTNYLRKTNVFIGVTVPIFTLLAVSFIPCSYRYFALVCFIIFSMALEMSISGGYFLSLLDLCPSYTHIMSGVANAVANVAGLLSAIATGYFRTTGTHDEWNHVFFIAMGFLMIAGLVYILFGSNELEPWGLVQTSETKEEEKKDTAEEKKP
ncbi:UNVERIFIED_CONTAM: hypothetical protein PYX00_003445 [Menopon gallinae]|uniref:Major facilitator superfamily (MFS) profile domain-containing protein n=1 Tax=Menopon gallinae TaxID=328185 RepID=A0AAW2I129_9NEOP